MAAQAARKNESVRATTMGRDIFDIR